MQFSTAIHNNHAKILECHNNIQECHNDIKECGSKKQHLHVSQFPKTLTELSEMTSRIYLRGKGGGGGEYIPEFENSLLISKHQARNYLASLR